MSEQFRAQTISDVMKAAALKVGIDGWVGVNWRRAEGGSVVQGYVCDGVYLRGPKKGKPRMDRKIAGTERTVILTDAEMEAHAEKYERDTGKCYRCKGTGQIQTGFSVANGSSMAECGCCGATGVAP